MKKRDEVRLQGHLVIIQLKYAARRAFRDLTDHAALTLSRYDLAHHVFDRQDVQMSRALSTKEAWERKGLRLCLLILEG